MIKNKMTFSQFVEIYKLECDKNNKSQALSLYKVLMSTRPDILYKLDVFLLQKEIDIFTMKSVEDFVFKFIQDKIEENETTKQT